MYVPGQQYCFFFFFFFKIEPGLYIELGGGELLEIWTAP